MTRFLCEHRTGHCEYFATATTLLLRAAKIPARYAVGYAKPRTAQWATPCPNAEKLVWNLVQLPTAEVTPRATADAVLRAWERWA